MGGGAAVKDGYTMFVIEDEVIVLTMMGDSLQMSPPPSESQS